MMASTHLPATVLPLSQSGLGHFLQSGGRYPLHVSPSGQPKSNGTRFFSRPIMPPYHVGGRAPAPRRCCHSPSTTSSASIVTASNAPSAACWYAFTEATSAGVSSRIILGTMRL